MDEQSLQEADSFFKKDLNSIDIDELVKINTRIVDSLTGMVGAIAQEFLSASSSLVYFMKNILPLSEQEKKKERHFRRYRRMINRYYD